MSKKLSYEFIKNKIESKDYKLLSKEYKNAKEKLKLQCPLGHKYESTYSNFKQGKKCPICNNIKIGNRCRINYNYIKFYIESYGYTLISKEYINRKTKLKIKCPIGHKFEMTWGGFKINGNRCPKCSVKMNGSYCKLSYNQIKLFIESKDHKLLSKEYKNAKEKLKLQCPNNHSFLMNYDNFKQGQRCPICYYESKSSKPEREIQDFISNFYDGIIINNDRNTIINPQTGWNLELDIYLPEINKAIEFNGSYWHSIPNVIYNDRIKQEQCKYNNINLLTIHEDNWINNKEICLQVIENFVFNTKNVKNIKKI